VDIRRQYRGCLDKDDPNEGGEKWSDLEDILKTEQQDLLMD
jgi:hypothetical protein